MLPTSLSQAGLGHRGQAGRLTSSLGLDSSSPRAFCVSQTSSSPCRRRRASACPCSRQSGCREERSSLRTPRGPRLLPLPATPAPWQGPRLRGQVVSPPRTGPLQSVPLGGPPHPAHHPAPQPAASLPRPGRGPGLPSCSRLPSLPLNSGAPATQPQGVKAAPDGPPNRSGLKVTYLQGLQEAQRLLPDVGQRACRNHKKPWLGGFPSPSLGLQDTRWERTPSLHVQGGWAGPPACGARRQVAALLYPVPTSAGGSPCLTLSHPSLGARTPGCKHMAGAKNTGFTARQALAYHSPAGCPGKSASP